MEEQKKHCEGLVDKLSLKKLQQQELRQNINEAELEAYNIEEQLKKNTRTGRQPLSRSARQGQSSRSFRSEQEEEVQVSNLLDPYAAGNKSGRGGRQHNSSAVSSDFGKLSHNGEDYESPESTVANSKSIHVLHHDEELGIGID